MTKHIFVAGHNGMIGSVLVRQLSSETAKCSKEYDALWLDIGALKVSLNFNKVSL